MAITFDEKDSSAEFLAPLAPYLSHASDCQGLPCRCRLLITIAVVADAINNQMLMYLNDDD